ncbi:SagB-type dehydrogenase family enzyme [Parabacteroides sp. PFB2-12]|uniref:SagB/ThcOx family dehydrogenase n=1 Tax=unclassified Parabacteroides TaxID=2649774 RepID=UPI00247339D9|nr:MULTISPECIES: SagB/ThcOx family dehydrogenase [unclassified Parabacteroides]MDH6342279.1 SagB-type dehydrogenase family enzyme [Parabacteroides sp. PM6-13]MDH6390622.1 SagB-type dehydrogenase family enzyme [Parabacteroides sp. PFB2-12]
MKKIIVLLVAFAMGFSMQAQEMKVIKLNAPNKTKGDAVMKVFNERQSIREYAAKDLSPQDLSDLLWAANGVNRPDGKRTAPSARNVQDVDIYVVMKGGAYLYDAKAHALNPVAPGDHRAAVAGGQDFVKAAPLSLVLVSDLSRLGNAQAEHTKLMGAVDVGIVCQNINMACAGLGLATVPRGSMDHEALAKALKLKETQLLLMNNPVGYPK